MYCSKCGKEIHDEAVVCPNCGCSTGGKIRLPESPASEDYVRGALVAVSMLFPIVGVIMGIVNLCKKKTKSGTTYLLVGIVAWIVGMVLISKLY